MSGKRLLKSVRMCVCFLVVCSSLHCCGHFTTLPHNLTPLRVNAHTQPEHYHLHFTTGEMNNESSPFFSAHPFSTFTPLSRCTHVCMYACMYVCVQTHFFVQVDQRRSGQHAKVFSLFLWNHNSVDSCSGQCRADSVALHSNCHSSLISIVPPAHVSRRCLIKCRFTDSQKVVILGFEEPQVKRHMEAPNFNKPPMIIVIVVIIIIIIIENHCQSTTLILCTHWQNICAVPFIGPYNIIRW